jgi:hypothetical protein
LTLATVQAASLRFIHIKSLPFEDGPEKIERMLKVVAEGISRQADVAITNIFINHRPAHSGCVFDTGELATW